LEIYHLATLARRSFFRGKISRRKIGPKLAEKKFSIVSFNAGGNVDNIGPGGVVIVSAVGKKTVGSIPARV
jgi:hypothetical protein